MSNTEVVLVGARGQARDFVPTLERTGGFKIKCLIDEVEEDSLYGYPIVHPKNFDRRCRKAFLCVGFPAARALVLQQYADYGFEWQSFIDSSAVLSGRAKLGVGTMIMAQCALSVVELDDHVFLNVGATLGHDVKIGACSAFMPRAFAMAYAEIGPRTLLSVNARIEIGVKVGADCKIGSDAVVRQDVPDGYGAVGRPARLVPPGQRLDERA